MSTGHQSIPTARSVSSEEVVDLRSNLSSFPPTGAIIVVIINRAGIFRVRVSITVACIACKAIITIASLLASSLPSVVGDLLRLGSDDSIR
jgi:hypothetical protein